MALEDHLSEMARHIDSGGNIGLAIPPNTLVLDADTTEAVQWLERHPAFEDAPSQETRKGRHYMVLAPAEAAGWPPGGVGRPGS